MSENISLQKKRIVVLIFTAFYIPGYKGGGPIRSVYNMVESLSDIFDFYIVTSDRDLDDKCSYKGIKKNRWVKCGKSKVLYLSPDIVSYAQMILVINDIKFDILYLNSFFSPIFTILPLVVTQFRLLRRVPIVIAPRGEFSIGALLLKKNKKSIYINLISFIGLYNNIYWHASNEYESDDIKRGAPRNSVFINNIHIANILIASDIANKNRYNLDNLQSRKLPKKSGFLDLAFLSRISRKKNLYTAIKILRKVQAQVEFNIYGPIEDKAYWKECEDEISLLPSNIKVLYHGTINNSDVHQTLSSHQFFFFPTLGENFGHVILEALLSGLPLILSDQTPWRSLETMRVGWDISLSRENDFKEVIDYCASMDDYNYQIMSNAAIQYGNSYTNKQSNIQDNKELFLFPLKSKT